MGVGMVGLWVGSDDAGGGVGWACGGGDGERGVEEGRAGYMFGDVYIYIYIPQKVVLGSCRGMACLARDGSYANKQLV
jgi:hypothetical protein